MTQSGDRPTPVFVHYLQGLLMGAADSVPGVSGGTMALIVGIYERLLASIGDGARALVALVRLDPPRFVEKLRQVEWRLLIPLLLGIVSALAVASRFILEALDRYPSQALGLFLGLVAGSLGIPWRRISAPLSRSIPLVVVAAVAAFFFAGLPAGINEHPATWQVFVSAMVAICAMILPGVSGAYVLKVLGIYEPTLGAVRDLDVLYVAVFVVGAVLGLGTFAVVLARLLSHRHDGTMAVLVGLMVGSLRALWPWQTVDRELLWPGATDPVVSVVVAVLVGLAAVILIERVGRRALFVSGLDPAPSGDNP